jgi:hypothetical protein
MTPKSGGAAARVRAKYAAREQRLVKAADAAERAWSARLDAVAAVEKADDRFRDAVAALVAEDQSLEEVSDLAQVPIEAVRAARRPKRTVEVAEVPARDAGLPVIDAVVVSEAPVSPYSSAELDDEARVAGEPAPVG